MADELLNQLQKEGKLVALLTEQQKTDILNVFKISSLTSEKNALDTQIAVFQARKKELEDLLK